MRGNDAGDGPVSGPGKLGVGREGDGGIRAAPGAKPAARRDTGRCSGVERWDGLASQQLGRGDPVPGPGCNLGELCELLDKHEGTWEIRNQDCRAKSWKFFVEARSDVLLEYRDGCLAISTNAPWWGIWLNLGIGGVRCVGVEPTNHPTDSLADVGCRIPAKGSVEVEWSLTVSG